MSKRLVKNGVVSFLLETSIGTQVQYILVANGGRLNHHKDANVAHLEKEKDLTGKLIC